jgi:hypothetical protein
MLNTWLTRHTRHDFWWVVQLHGIHIDFMEMRFPKFPCSLLLLSPSQVKMYISNIHTYTYTYTYTLYIYIYIYIYYISLMFMFFSLKFSPGLRMALEICLGNPFDQCVVVATFFNVFFSPSWISIVHSMLINKEKMDVVYIYICDIYIYIFTHIYYIYIYVLWVWVKTVWSDGPALL